jgi:hypothetical protein
MNKKFFAAYCEYLERVLFVSNTSKGAKNGGENTLNKLIEKRERAKIEVVECSEYFYLTFNKKDKGTDFVFSKEGIIIHEQEFYERGMLQEIFDDEIRLNGVTTLSAIANVAEESEIARAVFALEGGIGKITYRPSNKFVVAGIKKVLKQTNKNIFIYDPVGVVSKKKLILS